MVPILCQGEDRPAEPLPQTMPRRGDRTQVADWVARVESERQDQLSPATAAANRSLVRREAVALVALHHLEHVRQR